MTRKSHKGRARKAGMAPGALIHIGDVKTTAPSLSAIWFTGAELNEKELTSPADIAALPDNGYVRWINVHGLHDAGLIAALGKEFNLHPLLLEDILNTDQRPKVDEYSEHIFVVAHVFERTPQGLQRDQISLVLGRGFVLSFQERPTGTFDPIRTRLRQEKSPLRTQTADFLAYTMLDALVDRQFALIEALTDRAERLEDLIFAGGKDGRTVEALSGVHVLKREVVELRRTVWPLREVLHTLQHNPGSFFGPATLWYLRDVYDHTVHVVESLDGLREMLSGLLDVHLSSVSNRVNRELRLLTAIATVFMPLSLIAGIFGMNFRSMPWIEHVDGFSLALGLMAGVATTMLLIFWRRRMI